MNSGQIIRELLNEKGRKQKWLAEKLSISPATLSVALKRDLPFDLIANICEILEISIDEVYLKYQQKKDTEHPAKNDSVSKTNKDT